MVKLGYRERCLAQKINACNACGTGGELIVHHINGDRDDGRLENLVPLCRNCHAKIHTAADPDGIIEHLRSKLPESAIRENIGQPVRTRGEGPKRRITVSANEDYVDVVDNQRKSTTSRAEWFRGAGRIRLELERAVEAAGMADELDDEWWQDWLYNAVREELDNREQRMVAEDRAEREETEA